MAISTGTAILGGALIGGGASLAAGSMQADAAEGAGALYLQGQREAIAEQRRQYDQNRTDLAPWRETGSAALSEYGRLYGVGRDGLLSEDEMKSARDRFMATPGYDFRLSEGMKALDRSAAARGVIHGGGYGKELIRYGQGLATEEFDNYANRLAGLAGMGQQATNTGVAAGTQTAGNISNLTMAGANAQGNALIQAATARASGYAGVGNAAGGAVNNYLISDLLKRPDYTTTRHGTI